MPLLATLGVAHSGIGDRGVRALARELQAVPNLTSLKLAGNPLGAGLDALLQAATQLRHLDLSGGDLSRAAQTALRAGLRHLPALASLDLSEVPLGVNGLRALELGLQQSSALTHLVLRDAEVCPAPGRPAGPHATLGRILERAPALRALDLSGLELGADGVRRVAGGLLAATGLTVLGLEGNSMGEAGARDLAGALGRLPGLERLAVGGNGLRNGGATLLADALRGAAALAAVDVSDNDIGVMGLRRLATALRRAPPLPSVKFERCSATEPTHPPPPRPLRPARLLCRALHHCCWQEAESPGGSGPSVPYLCPELSLTPSPTPDSQPHLPSLTRPVHARAATISR